MSRKNDLVIRVSNLDKCYQKRNVNSEGMAPFYALQNVSFEVNKGEVLGIIGRNGSGKSTLLKILSGITKPTEGEVEIFGMPSSILDVGTGIHPDLTGRENTYLRGQLLRMSKKEVNAVFDELVDFSGVEEFIDSPVKHYSSGMFLRLAFSIIVHLRSEILLLDEVLAVGDAEFKRKCTAKIGNIVANGSTVVMAGHDMGTVMDLTTKVMLLSKGQIEALGTPKDVVRNSYLEGLDPVRSDGSSDSNISISELRSDRIGFEVYEFDLFDVNGRQSRQFASEDSISIHLKYRIWDDNINLAIGITDIMDGKLIDDSPVLVLKERDQPRQGGFHVKWAVPPGLFNAGSYFIDLFVVDFQLKTLKRYDRVLHFRVTDDTISDDVQGFYRSAFKVDLNMKIERFGS